MAGEGPTNGEAPPASPPPAALPVCAPANAGGATSPLPPLMPFLPRLFVPALPPEAQEELQRRAWAATRRERERLREVERAVGEREQRAEEAVATAPEWGPRYIPDLMMEGHLPPKGHGRAHTCLGE